MRLPVEAGILGKPGAAAAESAEEQSSGAGRAALVYDSLASLDTAESGSSYTYADADAHQHHRHHRASAPPLQPMNAWEEHPEAAGNNGRYEDGIGGGGNADGYGDANADAYAGYGDANADAYAGYGGGGYDDGAYGEGAAAAAFITGRGEPRVSQSTHGAGMSVQDLIHASRISTAASSSVASGNGMFGAAAAAGSGAVAGAGTGAGAGAGAGAAGAVAGDYADAEGELLATSLYLPIEGGSNNLFMEALESVKHQGGTAADVQEEGQKEEDEVEDEIVVVESTSASATGGLPFNPARPQHTPPPPPQHQHQHQPQHRPPPSSHPTAMPVATPTAKAAPHVQPAAISGAAAQPAAPAAGPVRFAGLHKAATIIQAAWRGFWVRCTDMQTATIRREIRTRRAEKQINMLMHSAHAMQEQIHRGEDLRRLQQDAIRMLWDEVQSLTAERDRATLREQTRAAVVIQRYWRGHSARKVWGPALRHRLLDNLSGVQRLRAAVHAGNTTALVELCLHLQDQVDSLNLAMTKVTGPEAWNTSAVQTQQYPSASNSPAGKGSSP